MHLIKLHVGLWRQTREEGVLTGGKGEAGDIPVGDRRTVQGDSALVTQKSQKIHFCSVVLPAPFSPKSPTISPCGRSQIDMVQSLFGSIILLTNL